MDHFKTSVSLIRMLEEQRDFPQSAPQSVVRQLEQSIAEGYDPTDRNYYLFNTLLHKKGLPSSIVYPFLKEVVRQPAFILKKDTKHYSTETLMSFWRDVHTGQVKICLMTMRF